MKVDYIKLFATHRHIAETVFNRAADSKVKLSAETVADVLKTSANLALLAHVGERK